MMTKKIARRLNARIIWLFYFFVPKTWIALSYNAVLWVWWWLVTHQVPLVPCILGALAATEVMKGPLASVIFVELTGNRFPTVNFVRLVRR